jgi:predicted nucleic acid-binding protein
MRTFIDTNILLCAIDRADPVKQEAAIRLVETHAKNRTGIISTQVLQEFHSAATRKLGIDAKVSRQHLRDFRVFDIVQITPELIETGIGTSLLHQTSFWDGLILAAASAANANELLTEDLSHGQTIDGITVRNPF